MYISFDMLQNRNSRPRIICAIAVIEQVYVPGQKCSCPAACRVVLTQHQTSLDSIFPCSECNQDREACHQEPYHRRHESQFEGIYWLHHSLYVSSAFNKASQSKSRELDYRSDVSNPKIRVGDFILNPSIKSGKQSQRWLLSKIAEVRNFVYFHSDRIDL